MTVDELDLTRTSLRWSRELFIDGEWRPARAGGRRSVIDPATEEEVASVAFGDAQDAESAVLAARRAFDAGTWAALGVAERARALRPALDFLIERQDELVEMEVAECGSPVKTATFLHVGFALAHIEYFLEAAPGLRLERPLPFNSPPFSVSTVLREPIGVVSAITPFNFPLLLTVWKAIPALLMGNSVVVKPNPLTPLSAMLLAEALQRCELPPGLFNVVTGEAAAGSLLAAHPAVDKVTFTGSTPVGRAVLASAAETIKSVTLELGGKSPSLILDDADLDLAIDGILFGVNFYAGQCCEAGSRVFVPRNLEHEVVERLACRAGDIRLGDTTDWDTDLGPVISNAQLERLERLIGEAGAQGATIACGGRRATRPRGFYFEPTIMRDVSPDMFVAREELFGPVLVVLAYDDLDDAVRMANDTAYGLGATVWSTDLQRAYEAAKRLRAGTVWINDHHMIRPDAPFGGYRQSGLGRELGDEGFFDFTEVKHLYMNLDPKRESRFWSMLLPDE